MVDRWFPFHPHYDEQPLFMTNENLRVAFPMGSFVLVERVTPGSEGLLEVLVGRLLSTDRNDTCRVNLFPRLSGSSITVPIEVESELCRGVQEVFQSGEIVEILKEEVKDIAFVFHSETINAKMYSLEGVTNAYQIRFRSLSSTGHPERMAQQSIFSFPCEHPAHQHTAVSYQKRVWNSLLFMREKIEATLCRHGQRQGDFPRQKHTTLFDPDAFQYIARRVNVICTERPSKRKKATLSSPPLLSVAGRVDHVVTCVKFDTKEKIGMLQGLLGSTIPFGIRHRRPKAGERISDLTNNMLNIVDGDPGYVNLDYLDGRLSIYIKAKSYLFGVQGGELINCNSDLFKEFFDKYWKPNNVGACVDGGAGGGDGDDDDVGGGNNHFARLQPGRSFKKDGKVYRVSMVSEVGVQAKVLSGNLRGTVVEFENKQAILDLVQQFN